MVMGSIRFWGTGELRVAFCHLGKVDLEQHPLIAWMDMSFAMVRVAATLSISKRVIPSLGLFIQGRCGGEQRGWSRIHCQCWPGRGTSPSCEPAANFQGKVWTKMRCQSAAKVQSFNVKHR